MKAYKLIAGAAAILLTFASLRAVLYNVDAWQPIGTSHISTPAHVTNLAPVTVRPSAAERRAAALIDNGSTDALAAVPAAAQLRLGDTIEPLGLLGAQWVMPYYSFGKKFGRITKE
ncbi:MAG: hypothetical protein ACTHJ9_03225 [Rhodanobacter sp.]